MCIRFSTCTIIAVSSDYCRLASCGQVLLVPVLPLACWVNDDVQSTPVLIPSYTTPAWCYIVWSVVWSRQAPLQTQYAIGQLRAKSDTPTYCANKLCTLCMKSSVPVKKQTEQMYCSLVGTVQSVMSSLMRWWSQALGLASQPLFSLTDFVFRQHSECWCMCELLSGIHLRPVSCPSLGTDLPVCSPNLLPSATADCIIQLDPLCII